jgi:hypothetical protein
VTDTLNYEETDADGYKLLRDDDGQIVWCNVEGCTNPIYWRGRGFKSPLCRTHRPPPQKKGKTRRKDSAPRVVFEVGRTKPQKKSRETEVTEGATAMLNVVAAGIAMSGDAVCSTAVREGAPALAEALGDLSKYHPQIAKFFAPMGGESEFGAWIGLGMAGAPIVVTVLSHHNLLPASVGAKIGGIAGQVLTLEADQVIVSNGAVENETVVG